MAVKTEKYNLGWALTRPFVCFLVILEHFWIRDKPLEKSWQVPFEMLLSISVPVFMFMSFYLVEKHLTSGDRTQLYRRIKRISWPLIGWAVIYFSVLTVESYLMGHASPSITDMLWQAVTGHSPALNASMWFQTVLLFLTIILFFIIKIAPRKILSSLILLIACATYFVWSGFNYKVFGSLIFELKYPLGRIAEMIPFAVLGYAAAHYDILERSRKYSKWLFPLFLLLTVLSVWLLSGRKEGGFGYSALFFLPVSLCLLVTMWNAPFDKIGLRTKKALLFVSSFTLGIYCMHRLIHRFVLKCVTILGFEIDTFYICALTYLTSFWIAFFISRIPSKLARQLIS